MTNTTAEENEVARKFFAQPCDFVLAAAAPEQFPASPLPEVAFIGRSNVGKSSLINALTGRKNLARASNTPGRTQQIIFFDLAHRLMLADLPGYGFAEAPQEEKTRWNELMSHYLKTRSALRCVCLLIDGRHGILTNDVTMMQSLDRAAVSYQIVLTKIDQVRVNEREVKLRHVLERLKKHQAARPEALMTSSEKSDGIESLRVFLASFAASI